MRPGRNFSSRLARGLSFALLSFAAMGGKTAPVPPTDSQNRQQTLSTVLAEWTTPSGIRFQFAPELANDRVWVRPQNGNWNELIDRLLKGYNYLVTRNAMGGLEAVNITGRNGDGVWTPATDSGLPPASSLLTYRKPPTGLPDEFRHHAAGSIYSVDVPVTQLRQGKKGDRYSVDLPSGRYQLTQDNAWTHENGDLTWVASIQGLPTGFRAILTLASDGSVVGRIGTPAGVYQFEPVNASNWLVDVASSGLTPGSLQDDGVAHPDALSGQATAAAMANQRVARAAKPKRRAARAAAQNGNALVDVLVLYTPGMNRPNLSTRLNHLFDLANQALVDSRVAGRFNMVAAKQVTYSNGGSSSQALNNLTDRQGAFANVSSWRTRFGADAVALLRPFRSNSQGAICGIAWVNGSGNADLTRGQSFAVVSYGTDNYYFCSDYTLAHELGHVLGAAHDRAHAGGVPGRFAFSYGYGIEDRFGDIMSYISPEIGIYANPNLTTCDGSPCGIPQGQPNAADIALTFNRTMPVVAKFAQ